GNFLENDEGKSGNHYTNYGGFCLEAQHYIDSPNQKNFPKIELKANEEYRNTIVYKFSIIK
ncbi:galactose-1-epimerase, partial [Acinetobacter baumannii]